MWQWRVSSAVAAHLTGRPRKRRRRDRGKKTSGISGTSPGCRTADECTQQSRRAFVGIAGFSVEPDAACESHRDIEGRESPLVLDVQLGATLGQKPDNLIVPLQGGPV